MAAVEASEAGSAEAAVGSAAQAGVGWEVAMGSMEQAGADSVQDEEEAADSAWVGDVGLEEVETGVPAGSVWEAGGV